MTTAEILEAASPRPWGIAPRIEQGVSVKAKLANDSLIVLAVNAYERDQRVIKALSEALTQAVYALDHIRAGRNPIFVNFDVIENVMQPALALAKEAQK